MIRVATVDDITEIVALCLVGDVFNTVSNFTNIKPEISKITTQLSGLLTAENPLVFVYIIGGRIVGFIAGELYEHMIGQRKYATDYALYVAVEYRSKNIGYKLLKYFFDQAILAGANELRTTVPLSNFNSESMEKLLKRFGFELDTKTYRKVIN